MRKFIIGFLLLFGAENSLSAQWITLSNSSIDNIQLIQSGNSAGSPEGLYVVLKADLVGEVASYCSRKNLVVITDPKLIDRAYSGLMYAISTQRTVQFYADGIGKCILNAPQVTAFVLKV